jgi:hypothetical protein
MRTREEEEGGESRVGICTRLLADLLNSGGPFLFVLALQHF